jgi:hypothetical protein
VTARSTGRITTAVLVAIAALAVAVAALVVAVTRSSTTKVVKLAAPTTTTTVATCTSSRAEDADFVAKVHQNGQAAYESQPVKVTGNGTYTLFFGPVTSRDAERFRTRSGGGLSFPITADQFLPQADLVHMTKVVKSGATYIHVPMTVRDFKATCTALRAWLQY